MTAYRTAWTACWFTVLVPCAALAQLVMGPGAAAGAFVLGAVAAVALGLVRADAAGLRRWRPVTETAGWAGLTCVAACLLSVWRPGAGALLATAVGLTSPAVVSAARARCVSAGLAHPSISAYGARSMTLVELADAWLDSSLRLGRAGTAAEALRVVLERELLLAEIELRRAPGSHVDELDPSSGPGPAGEG